MFYRVLVALFIVGLSLSSAAPVFADGAKPNIPNADLIPPDQGAGGPTTAPTGKEWPKPTQAQFDEGKRVFQNRCARCHGWNMVNLGSIAFDLRQFPHDDAVRFFHDVRYGKNAMPAWKGILTEEDFANVWSYVRTGGKL